jgi:hypothetical protein
MSSSLADPLYERLIRAFPADCPYTREDWIGDPMPRPVQHFLVQMLRHQCRHEARRLKEARTGWVDYDHPEMERATRRFVTAVEEHMQVPRTEWEGALQQATHHVTAYLVRPVPVLTRFAFGDRTKALGVDQILWRMKFFGPYAYLREAVQAFADERGVDSFPRERYERFLYRIDERVTASYNADRWLRLLDPLFTIAKTAADRRALPVEMLQTFFAEKEADAIEKQLKAYASQGRRQVDPDTLYRLLRGGEATVSDGRAFDGRPSEPAPPPRGDESPAETPPAETPPAETPPAEDPSLPASEPTPGEPGGSGPPSESNDRSTGIDWPDEAPDPPAETPREAPASRSSEATPGASAEPTAGRGGGKEEAGSGEEASGVPPAPDGDRAEETRPEESGSENGRSGDDRSGRPEDDQEKGEPATPGQGLHDQRAATGGSGDVWGVAGPARPAGTGEGGGSPSDGPSGNDAGGAAGDDESAPLWKRFQQSGGPQQSTKRADEPADDEGGEPLWARFKAGREGAAAPGSAQNTPSDGPSARPSDAEGERATGGGQEGRAPRGAGSRDAESAAQSSAASSGSEDLEALEREILGAAHPSHRSVYIRQLFDGAADEYRAVLRRLRTADSWSEASDIIAEDVFRSHKVNIYSDAAVQFTNAVENRFRQ